VPCRLSFAQAYRSLKRCQRKLTGASTLTSRKNGRRNSMSTALSSRMSVVTQRSLHRSVTKSSNSSTFANVWSASWGVALDGMLALEADFSTAGVAAVRARCRRLNRCSSTRYDAMEPLPAQMPAKVSHHRRAVRGFACLRTTR
jgi:hypothetical protein